MKRKLQMMLATVVLLPLSLATAQQPTPEARAVEYRQSILRVINYNWAPLVAVAQGQLDYEAEASLARAERVAFMLSLMHEAFRRDTAGTNYQTQARAVLWSEMAQFDRLLAEAEEVSGQMVEAAETGEFARVRTAVGEMGQACRACHDRYRDIP